MHKRQARRSRLAAPPASAFPALSKTGKHNNKGDWRMADPSNFDENPAGRVAREQTLARLMEAAAMLAAARIAPGDGNEAVETTYQCCLSIVTNEYQRLIRCGFINDPVQAVSSYSIEMEGMTGFAPS
jgi:hypothetical protein